jgi:copper oxidase (laccase) domain-containing protein
MKYFTHNDSDDVCANGTCLQGYLTANYNNLVALFGPSTDADGYKVDWEWVIKFEDGTVATIYNWKNGPNYGYDRAPTSIQTWHIGGNTERSVAYVEKLYQDNLTEIASSC